MSCFNPELTKIKLKSKADLTLHTVRLYGVVLHSTVQVLQNICTVHRKV